MKLRGLTTVAMVALLAIPVHAAELKGTATFGWTYVPTALELAKGQYFTTGRAQGQEMRTSDDANLKLAAIDCLGWSAPDGHSGGSCVDHNGDGDAWWVDYTCNEPATPPPGALFACKGSAQAKGGTGRYASIKGGNTFTQVIVRGLPDGSYVGYTIEDYDLSF